MRRLFVITSKNRACGIIKDNVDLFGHFIDLLGNRLML